VRRQLGPLINDIGTPRLPARVFSYMRFLRGEVPLGETPTILVRVQASYRLVSQAPPPQVRFSSPPGLRNPLAQGDQTVEITSACLEEVEFLSPEWLRAWRDLDMAMEKIVDESLTAPGAEKRQSLEQTMERASVAYNTMARASVTDEQRALARKVEPTVRIVTSSQRHYAAEWRCQLEVFIKRLGIEPATPLLGPSGPPPRQRPVNESTATRGVGVVRCVDDDLMAQKLILGGYQVGRVLEEGRTRGVQAGDVILTYTDVFGVVREGQARRPDPFVLPDHLGDLRILRGDAILVLAD
jgi:hypothetical protein